MREGYIINNKSLLGGSHMMSWLSSTNQKRASVGVLEQTFVGWVHGEWVKDKGLRSCLIGWQCGLVLIMSVIKDNIFNFFDFLLNFMEP